MKPLDRLIQRLRISQAQKYIPFNSSVLDIGCADGAMFQQIPEQFNEGIGIDPKAQTQHLGTKFQLIQGFFPDDLPAGKLNFDVITLLAVLEHIPIKEQAFLAKNIFKHLNNHGILIITVPSATVDIILNLLRHAHLIDGMSLEEHYGFDINTIPGTFTHHGFTLVHRKYFQLGLNNLFVFQKSQGRIQKKN